MAANMNDDNNNNRDEPAATAPPPDRWFNLTLGSSFKDHNPSSKFCTLRYEFKPASIDKNQPGTLHKNKDNKVTVEFQNNQPGKSRVCFEGSSEDYKENDAVLFFDGESFRLERLHRSVKRLRHVRQPGESVAAATSVTPAAEASPPPIGKASKFQASNKGLNHPVSVEVETIDIGGFKNSDTRSREERVLDQSSAPPNPSHASPDLKNDDLEEELDILNVDDDVVGEDKETASGRENFTGIDINIPHQNESDDEIDLNLSDDDADKGPNAAEALRAQVNAEEKKEYSSSSSDSSASSSGSGSGSGSRSGSGSSSSDSESSGDSVNSI